MSSHRHIGLVSCVWLACASTAFAETISFSASAPMRRTNWSDTLYIPQFDPSLGQLDSIDFDLNATVQGDARFENLNPTPRKVIMSLRAMLEMRRPDNTVLQVALPESTVEQVVGGFDGVLDFMGPSGRSYLGISAVVTEARSSPDPVSDLSLFTGTGMIALPVTASGQSSISGGGNLAFLFNTFGQAALTVTYTYSIIPEPALGAMIVLALLLHRRVRSHR
jgi:hypothetical protein